MARLLAIVVLVAASVVFTLAVKRQAPAPKMPAVQLERPGSYSWAAGGGSLTRSASTGLESSQSSAVSNADPATLHNGVNIYNSLVAVIRDVVLPYKP